MTHTSKPTAGRARKIAILSLFFLPIYGIPAAIIPGWESPLANAFIVTGAILYVALVIVAWVTRNSAPAIVALLMPFASIPITILAILSDFARNW